MTTFFNLNPDIDFPDSDGKPMADNTEQFRWIVLIKENLEALFANDPNVFVAGDLFWYPIKSKGVSPVAPDAMVAFGRPKGRRGSYKQWEENNIPPQVVFEVLSPGNDNKEMERKFKFYETYGVEEYYLYNPDTYRLDGWIRQGDRLLEIQQMNGFRSPRLNICFDTSQSDLVIYYPNGETFLTFAELKQQVEIAKQQAEIAKKETEAAKQETDAAKQRAEAAKQEADAAKQRAEAAKQEADAAKQEADAAKQRAETAEQRAERFAAYMRSLGLDPNNLP